MPEIKFESEWLKAHNNVNQGDNVRFIDAGHKDKDGNWIFVVGIVPDGQRDMTVQKKFQLNKKNFTAVSAIYGTNSDKWVGKEMKVRVVRVENPRTGDMTDSVRLIAPGGLASGADDAEED
jgi:hypothetical protein